MKILSLAEMAGSRWAKESNRPRRFLSDNDKWKHLFPTEMAILVENESIPVGVRLGFLKTGAQYPAESRDAKLRWLACQIVGQFVLPEFEGMDSILELAHQPSWHSLFEQAEFASCAHGHALAKVRAKLPQLAAVSNPCIGWEHPRVLARRIVHCLLEPAGADALDVVSVWTLDLCHSISDRNASDQLDWVSARTACREEACKQQLEIAKKYIPD